MARRRPAFRNAVAARAGSAGKLTRVSSSSGRRAVRFGTDEEALDGQLALALRADERHRGVEGEQARDQVRRGRGIDEIAADGADIAHLVPADHLGALDEAAQGARRMRPPARSRGA